MPQNKNTTRVVLFSRLFFPHYVGGGERLTLLTAKALQENGLSPLVVTGAKTASEYEFEGIPVVTIPWEDEKHDQIEGALAQILQREDPLFVHIVGFLGSKEVIKAAKAAGLPVGASGTDYGQICANHTLVRGSGKICLGKTSVEDCFNCHTSNHPIRARLQARAGQLLPDSVVGLIRKLSKSLRGKEGFAGMDEWKNFRSTDEKRQSVLNDLDIFTVPGKFAEDHCRPFAPKTCNLFPLRYPLDRNLIERAPEKKPSTTLRIGFVGRALPIKGIEILLQAAQALRNNKEFQFKFYVATNEADEYSEKCRAIANSLQNCSWMEPGFLNADKLVDIHAELNLLVVPSTWPEYVGLIILEALALGTPVLSSDFPQQREMLSDLPMCGLFEPNDSKALAKAIENFSKREKSAQNLISKFPNCKEYGASLLELYRPFKAGKSLAKVRSA